jgi:hypothetical protein
MPRIVTALIDNAPSDEPASDNHIKRALSEFDKVTQERNRLAHWQWAVGRDGEQEILNLTKPKADGSHTAESLDMGRLIRIVACLRAIQTILYANAASTRKWMTTDMRDTLTRDALHALT